MAAFCRDFPSKIPEESAAYEGKQTRFIQPHFRASRALSPGAGGARAVGMRLLVSDCMTVAPQTLSPRVSIDAARDLMRRIDVRHLPVLSNGRLVGLLGERELVFAADANDEPIAQWMNPGPFTVSPEDTLADAAETMATHKLEAVVVVEGDHVVGVLTSVDLARAVVVLSNAFDNESRTVRAAPHAVRES